jgi:murein DD-endopeptidase MepM/ murein hydrolase activator NlpD
VTRVARGLAVVIAAILVAPPLAAHAATTRTDPNRQAEIQQEIERLRGQLDEVAGDEAEAVADLRVTQRRKAEEQAQLTVIDQHVQAAMAELDAAQAKLDSASALAQDADHRVNVVTSRLDDARATLRDQAVSSFMRYGSGADQLDVVLRAKDINELHNAVAFVDTLAERQARIVNEFASVSDDANEARANAESTRADAVAQRNDVQTKADALQAQRAEQAQATAAAADETAHEQALLGSLRARRVEYERKLKEQQDESDAIAALLRRRGSNGPHISGHGSLSAPVRNPEITSTFGYRIHPIYGDRRLHAGVDFRAPTGTPLLAAAAGEVVFAGWKSGYGNTTIIDHGGGLATLYAHQSSIGVKVGQEVKRGAVIGLSGATGNVTGPHLHFEVRVNGTPVDPLGYL